MKTISRGTLQIIAFVFLIIGIITAIFKKEDEKGTNYLAAFFFLVAAVIFGYLFFSKPALSPSTDTNNNSGDTTHTGGGTNNTNNTSGNTPKDGDPCITTFNQNGTWQNGVCVQNLAGGNSSTSSSSSNDLEVSNPNGAFMYYQSPLASGGMLYSKSNVSLPAGTKLKLIKVWQTNTSTQPFAGYYETDYKQQYGANSGFFLTGDIKKV